MQNFIWFIVEVANHKMIVKVPHAQVASYLQNQTGTIICSATSLGAALQEFSQLNQGH